MSGMETDAVSKILGSLGSLVKSFSSNLKENVLSQSINETIEEISKQGELEHNQAVSELQQAKVQNLNAYLLVSLYFTHLKLNGDKLNADSNIMSEIKRVKEFMDKVKVAEKRLDQQEEKDTKRAEESEQFMNKHFGNRSSAVSSAHFQAQDEDNKPQGIHVRFDDKKTKGEVASALKKEQKGKTVKSEKSSNKISKPSTNAKKSNSKKQNKKSSN